MHLANPASYEGLQFSPIKYQYVSHDTNEINYSLKHASSQSFQVTVSVEREDNIEQYSTREMGLGRDNSVSQIQLDFT